MATITLRALELIFVCSHKLTKYQQDQLMAEFGSPYVIEVLCIEPIEDHKTMIKVLVPASFDLIQITVERTILRINSILRVA